MSTHQQRLLESLLPSFKPLAEVLLHDLEIRGIKCVVTDARRTLAQQDALYAKGRTTKGEGVTPERPMGRIVTKAKGGESPHNFGAAVDICPINPHDGSLFWDAPDDIWNVIHLLAEERGYLDSGYDWKFCDRPHIEDPHWKDQQALWKQGKVVIT